VAGCDRAVRGGEKDKSHPIARKAAFALLSFLVIAAIALIVPALIFGQRENRLSRLLNVWPEKDRGASSMLGPGEEGLPSPDLLILHGGQEESLYLVFRETGRLFISRLDPGLYLSEGEGGEVAALRREGLPALLGHLKESAGIVPRRCVALEETRLAELVEGAEEKGMCPEGGRWLQSLGELGGEGRCDELSGMVYACFSGLWREVFTSSAVWRHHGLQCRLASACRAMPASGYRDLQRWGEELPGPEGLSMVSMPLPRRDGEAGEDSLLDGGAFRELLGKLPGGSEEVAAFLAEHRRQVEWERRVRRLSIEPVPPAIVYGGNAERMEVAITLDDGGNLDARILDLLESYGIKCTVFPIGRWAERNPEWIRRMDALGWEVANHTYTHPIKKPNRLVDMPDDAVREELLAAQEVISGITGKRYPYFRPPGGWVDERVAALAGELGFITVMWSLDSLDAVDPNITPPDRAERILARVKPGQILLFHFGGYGTYDTLSYLIPRMQERGYRFVTLSRLFQP